MAKYKLEYIWLNGYEPVANLRGKTQVFAGFRLDELPLWGFDGSSTGRPKARPDCSAQTRRRFSDSTKKNGACEVMIVRRSVIQQQLAREPSRRPGRLVAASSRSPLQTACPSASPSAVFRRRKANTTPASATRTSGRLPANVDAHLDLCLDAGINDEAIHAEVAKGQWEFQIFGKGSKSRSTRCGSPVTCFVPLRRVRVDVVSHRKPLGKTGLERSGMSCIFPPSTCAKVGGKEYFKTLIAAFEIQAEHIPVYGPDNDLRLTGLHQTQSIDKFTYGIANRGAFIRVPTQLCQQRCEGYLESAVRTRRATRTKSRAAQSLSHLPPCRSSKSTSGCSIQGAAQKLKGRAFDL